MEEARSKARVPRQKRQRARVREGGRPRTEGREEEESLRTKLSEMLEEMTYSKLLEDEATASDSLTNILKKIPIPNGKAIFIG